MAHPIIARLEAIKAAFLKKAVQKQDVVDFYLLSLLPEEWLEKSEIGPDHINGRVLFDAIIMALREEYIVRGMEELKDEAETTKWTHEVRDENMPEQLKPYFTFHESGYTGRGDEDDDDYDSDPEYDTSCESCEDGLYSDDAYHYNDATYCSSCHDDKISEDLDRLGKYCVKHNVFTGPAFMADEGELPQGWQIEDKHRGCELISVPEGQKIQNEVDQNRQKQTKLPYKQDLYKNPPETPEVKLTEPIKMPNQAPAAALRHGRWLEIKAFRKQAGGAYWAAPEDFDGFTSTDYYNCFEYAEWRDNYGGPLWAEVARTINQMENTTDPKKTALLIDHFHDLGHNTGKLLDKFPEWSQWFKELLDLKASKDSVRRLIPMASSSVAKLVTEYYKINRSEDWRTPRYPKVDFSQPDINSIRKDPHAPQETLVDLCVFNATRDPYGVEDFARRLDDNHLDVLMSRLNALKKQKQKKKQTNEEKYSWERTIEYIDMALKVCSDLWEKRHKFEEIPSVSSKVPHLEKKADEWQGQKDAEPFGYPNFGMWSDPTVKEGGKGGATLSDAIKFFIEHGDRFNKQPTEIDLTSKMVKWSDGSVSNFDDFVELYSHHMTKKDADFGMMDGPVDQGKHHDGDFPSQSWMPSGEESKGVDTNYVSPASLIGAAVRSILAAEFKTDLEAPPVEPGQKEVTKYDPAGEFLIRLVKLVIKEGVPQEEVMALANAFPVATVDEAGDLASKIWTLATTKYKIPREWLIKKLPEAKAALNRTADSLQRGNAYVMRSVDQIDVEVDPKVEAILKTPNMTDDQKFDAIVERIKEMFWELGDESMVVKDTEWSPGEVDGSDVQGIIDDHNERIEEALTDAAEDAMSPEEQEQSIDRQYKAPWNR